MPKYKYAPLTKLKTHFFLYHSILGKYEINVAEYCILLLIAKLTKKREYCTVTKGDMCKFLRLAPNNFFYHFSKLIDRKLIEEVGQKRFKINDAYKADFDPYVKYGKTFTLFDFNFFEKLNVTLLQYCILDSIYVTHYRPEGEKKEESKKPSLESIARKLKMSRSGIHKAVAILEQKQLLHKHYGSYVELTPKIADDLRNLHLTKAERDMEYIDTTSLI